MSGPLDIHAGGKETRLPDDFRWPGGKRIAVFPRVSFEWWSDDKWPGIGPMGNPLKPGVPDLNAVGWAEYGHRRGIFRILEVLKRQGVKATVNVSGIMAERYPEAVRQIVEDGHEVVAHSYTMDMIPCYLSEDEERANIKHTTDLIAKATGRRPKGWISPRSTPSLRSPRLLAEAGFDWHGDTLNDDLPYLVDFGDRNIVAFPNNTEVNDLPLYMRYGNSPRVYLEIFEDWLESVRERESGPVRMDPAIHTHVFGRQPGLSFYERVLEIAKAADDIWMGTRSEAVAHVRRVLGK
ncbi:MAG TPA: polysaccharide deacetylase family protein [Pseudolabrys sp.]|nr:polysaccharide deacetylase family protein [Pseudolabrys sp.]